MSGDQKRQLEQQLWNIANELRGKMNADEFRDYILGFIFYKYLSEKQFLYANELLKGEKTEDYRTLSDPELLAAIKNESLETLGYFLEPNQLFDVLAKKGSSKEAKAGESEAASNYILDELDAVLTHIEQSTMGTESEEDFTALFEDIDLQSTKLGRSVSARNELISKVLSHLNKIDFKLEDSKADVLGDAYEYLIGQFAAGAGKKAGEFYTPQQVSTILAKIVTTGKKKLRSVYDPTCGSGSLLLRVAKEAQVSEFFGQEMNRTTFNLCRMNMILHGVHYRDFDIQQEDTLEVPKHLNLRFEAVVANPPFSAQWKSKDNPLHLNDERFAEYGRLAPTSKADFAFLQHMIYQLADNGTMACVLPHGVLFRGAAEGHIRQHLIKELNVLDAVIGLPANLFYGTSIPACILVLKKCRQKDDSILFIDASGDGHFEKVKNQNVLRDKDVELIVETYRERKVIDKFSVEASLAEIAENDWNLNIPRYVDTFEEEEPVDLDAVAKELRELENGMAETDREIGSFCEELGIAPPF
ncbi:MAG: type I restriction-modification system subunit M [Kiritimatiellales bacterium]|nr:type I restriction-modification system subunit M [Kiritimatiellales bacterium]